MKNNQTDLPDSPWNAFISLCWKGKRKYIIMSGMIVFGGFYYLPERVKEKLLCKVSQELCVYHDEQANKIPVEKAYESLTYDEINKLRSGVATTGSRTIIIKTSSNEHKSNLLALSLGNAIEPEWQVIYETGGILTFPEVVGLRIDISRNASKTAVDTAGILYNALKQIDRMNNKVKIRDDLVKDDVVLVVGVEP